MGEKIFLTPEVYLTLVYFVDRLPPFVKAFLTVLLIIHPDGFSSENSELLICFYFNTCSSEIRSKIGS